MQAAMMNLLARLGRNPLLAVGVALITLLRLVRIGLMLPGQVHELDFSHYYVSSRLLLEGKDPYGTPMAPLYQRFGFVFYQQLPTGGNPPLLLWLFAPFALLPPAGAFAMWAVVQAGSLAVILWLTRDLLRDRLSRRGWRLLCAATVCSVPVYWHFGFSQTQLLLAAMVLAGYRWHKAGRQTHACLTVAAAGLLKLFPLVLLPWFIWRSGTDVRCRLRRAGGALALVTLGVIATNPKLWSAFIREAVPLISASIINRVSDYTVPSLLINLGYAAHGFAPSPIEARGWWAAGTAAGVGLLVFAYRECIRTDAEPETAFCLLCVAMLAGSVTAWGHYFVFLIFPVAVAAVRLAARPSPQKALLFLLSLLAANNLCMVALDPWRTPILERHLYWKILADHIPLYGLLGLGIFFVIELRSRAHVPQPAC